MHKPAALTVDGLGTTRTTKRSSVSSTFSVGRSASRQSIVSYLPDAQSMRTLAAVRLALTLTKRQVTARSSTSSLSSISSAQAISGCPVNNIK